MPADAAPIDPPRPELRQGTLLFCDLVSSTELANRLDHDDLRLVFSSTHRIVREVTRRHTGYLIRFVGDGAFVAFGYPTASEDAAESAVRAGLDLVRSIRQLTMLPPAVLELRVGIASGTVAMGEMIGGAAIDELSVSGRVVHLAARLAAAGAPGSVLVCDETRRMIGKRFTLEPLPPLVLKGFPAPESAWWALAEVELPSRFDAHRASGGMAEMVGRDALLAQLAELWSRARQGSGQALQLVGPAGIGKSRLLHALGMLVSGEGVQQLDLHCAPRADHTPLFPVAVLLRRLADIRQGDAPPAAHAKASELLAALLPPESNGPAMRALGQLFLPQSTPVLEGDSPELARERTIAYLIDLMAALVTRSRVLLVVEDLHWADATTRSLLQRLVQAAAAWPMLLVVTSRVAEPGLGGDDRPVPLAILAPLTDAESRSVVRHAAAGAALDAAAIDDIVEQAEGNPLVLEELAMARREAPTEIDAGGARAEGRPKDVPAVLQTIVQARLDRLPSLKPLVQAASVMGREFSWQMLAGLTGAGAAITESIGTLIEHEILVATGTASLGALRFRHVLIQNAVYGTLLRGERQRLHGRAADLLAGPMSDSTESLPELLAHHLLQAGRVVEAIGALADASVATAERAAYQESIGHARAGMRLLARVDDSDLRRALHLRLVVPLGISLTATLGYADPTVEAAYAEALALCDEQTDPAAAYPVVRGLGSYHLVRGRIARADTLAQECLRMARQSGRADLLIDATSFAAYPALYLGRIAESHELSQTSLALYESEHGERYGYPNAQDPATAAWALLTTSAWLRGDLQGADAAAVALKAHVERRARPFDTTYGIVWLSASCQLQRRFGAAVAHGREGLAIAQKHGYSTWIPAATMQVCIGQGGHDGSSEAIATLQAVHGMFLQAGAEVSATFYLWGIAQALLKAGNPEAAREVVVEGLRRARAGDETYMTAELLILSATVDDDPDSAIRALREAAAHAESQQAATVALRAVCALVQRTAADAAAQRSARHALAVLDGEQRYPADPGWVAGTLSELNAALDPGLAARRELSSD